MKHKRFIIATVMFFMAITTLMFGVLSSVTPPQVEDSGAIQYARYKARREDGSSYIYYTTLQGAINAATENEVVEITRSHALSEPIVVNKPVTIVAQTGTITLTRAENFEGYLFNVGNEGNLTLGQDNPTGTLILDGENKTLSINGNSLVYSSGSLNIKNGVAIKNNRIGKRGVAVYVASGTFTMTGGSISGNTNGTGGQGQEAVYITGGATATISGGQIVADNVGQSAVTVAQTASLTVSNSAIIKGSDSLKSIIVDGVSATQKANLTVSGGSLENGIKFSKANVNLTSGSVGGTIEVLANSLLNLSGGLHQANITTQKGVSDINLNITGGTIGTIEANSGCALSISENPAISQVNLDENIFIQVPANITSENSIPVLPYTYNLGTKIATFNSGLTASENKFSLVNATQYNAKLVVYQNDILIGTTNDMVVTLNPTTFMSDGIEKSPIITVKVGGVTLNELPEGAIGNGYVVSGTRSAKDAGVYTINITGIGGYADKSASVQWTIILSIARRGTAGNYTYYDSIQAAVDASTGNETITILTSHELTETVVIENKSLTFVASGNVVVTRATTLKGNMFAIFNAGNTVTFGDITSSNMLVLDGNRNNSGTVNGSIIYFKDKDISNGDLVLRSGVSLINNNSSLHGSAILMEFGDLLIAGATIQNNRSTSNGGAIAFLEDAGILTITSGELSQNNANGFGGAIYAEKANIEITGGKFDSNITLQHGGAIYATNSAILISNATFLSNSANASGTGGGGTGGGGAGGGGGGTPPIPSFSGSGGAIYINNTSGTYNLIEINNSTFTSNSAQLYSAIEVNKGSLFVNNSTFTNNTSVTKAKTTEIDLVINAGDGSRFIDSIVDGTVKFNSGNNHISGGLFEQIIHTQNSDGDGLFVSNSPSISVVDFDNGTAFLTIVHTLTNASPIKIITRQTSEGAILYKVGRRPVHFETSANPDATKFAFYDETASINKTLFIDSENRDLVIGTTLPFEITMSQTSFTYTGLEINAKNYIVSVVVGGESLIENEHYTVGGQYTGIEVGEYTLVISGKNGYLGKTGEKTWTIVPSATQLIVTLTPSSFDYDGSIKTPAISVKAGTKDLVLGVDYEVNQALSTTSAVNAGEYTIVVNGRGNYSGTGSANWVINKVDITGVVFDEKTVVYNNEFQSHAPINLPEGVTISGYSTQAQEYNNFGALLNPTTVATNSFKEAGKYTITAFLNGGTNYNDGSVVGVFYINRAPVTYKADDKSSKYGESIVPLTFQKVSGTVYADQINVGNYNNANPGAFSISSTVTVLSNVGEYPITLTFPAGHKNYAVTTQPGVYTITKADLTGITFEDAEFDYDGTSKSITPNGVPTGFTTEISYVTQVQEHRSVEPFDLIARPNQNTNAFVEAGVYTIQATVNGGQNYNNWVGSAVMTIKRSMPTISFKRSVVNIVGGQSESNPAETNSDGLIIYVSANDDIAIVDAFGVITAKLVENSTTTITATALPTKNRLQNSAICTVNVIQAVAKIVSQGTTSYFSNIKSAMDFAVDGDKIIVIASHEINDSATLSKSIGVSVVAESNVTVTRGVNFNYPFFVVSSGTLTIGADSNPGGTLTLDGNKENAKTNTSSLISNSATLNIRNYVELRNNKASSTNGGAIKNTGTLNIYSGKFTSNEAVNGGVIYNSGSSSVINISGGIFGQLNSSNSATSQGGVIYSSAGNITISNSSTSFAYNASEKGGVFAISGTNLTINNGTFSYNSATNQGGVIYAETSVVSIANGAFSNNQATNNGGVIFISGNSLTIGGGNFTGNSATTGGVAYTGAVNVNGGSFSLNTATTGSAFDIVSGTASFGGSSVNINGTINVRSGVSSFSITAGTFEQRITLEGTTTFNLSGSPIISGGIALVNQNAKITVSGTLGAEQNVIGIYLGVGHYTLGREVITYVSGTPQLSKFYLPEGVQNSVEFIISSSSLILASTDILYITFDDGKDTRTYEFDGTTKRPGIIVKIGSNLVLERDATNGYTIESGSTESAINAGTYTINVRGLGVYSNKSGSITWSIVATTLKIVADNKDSAYGDPIVALTYTVSGLKGSDTVANTLTGSLSTTATSSSNVGTYPITQGTLAVVSSKANNYTIDFYLGTYTITAKGLTIIANNQTSVYGNSIVTLTFTATGFVGTDTVENTLTGSLSTTATSTSPVGTYPITQGTLAVVSAKANKYTINFTQGTYTITPRTIDVKAIDQSSYYGDSIKPLTYNATNFASGDTAENTLTGSLSTTATSSSPGGTYPIIQGTLAVVSGKSNNYTINFTPGTYTILAKMIYVTAENKESAYGEDIVPLTYTATGFVGSDNIANTLTGSLTTTATKTSPVGTYPITRGSLAIVASKATNYEINFTAGVYTIKSANRNVVWSNLTFTYDGTAKKPTATFVDINNQTITLTVITNPVNAIARGTHSASVPSTYENYTLSNTTTNFTINPKTLTVTYTEPITKVFDGTTTATIDIAKVGLSGIVGSDNVFVESVTGTYNSATVGTGKTVQINVTLGGTAKNNYTVSTPALTRTDGIITPLSREVSWSNLSFVYDGTAKKPTATFVDITGQTVTLTVTTTPENAINAGTHTASVATNYSNYTLTNTSTNFTIAKKQLTATYTETISKVYDGTKTANIDNLKVTLIGVVSGDVVTVATATGVYDNADIGTGKTVTISITLGGSSSGNYFVENPVVTRNDGIITAAPKDVVWSNLTFTYDGTAKKPTATFVDLSGQTITLTVTTTPASAIDAGTHSASVPSTYGNYTLSNTTTNFTINPKTLTASYTQPITKEYDGTTTANITIGQIAISGKVGTDDVYVYSATAQYLDANVGTNKTVTINITLGGAKSSNYTIANPAITRTDGIITAKKLTASYTKEISKVYDQTTVAYISVEDITLSGKIAGDNVSVASAVGVYDDKKVGTGKTVTITITLTGTHAGNYETLQITRINGIITKRDITATYNEAITKVYNGNTNATINSSKVSLVGVISGDTVTVASATGTYDNKNVGTGKTVTIAVTTGGTDGGNYNVLSLVKTNGEITKLEITASYSPAISKVYDGNTSATINASSVVLNGVISGDIVTVASATGTYDTPSVGTGKTVTISITLGGTDGGNYKVSDIVRTNGEIKKLEITANYTEAITKVYDATTSATIDKSKITLNGVLSGESLTVASATGTYDNKKVGTGKTVTIVVTISGTTSGNYLVQNITRTNGIIEKLEITATYTEAITKVYNGNTTAPINSSKVSLVGVLSGDTVTVASAVGEYNDKNVGTGKTVTISVTTGGNDGDNYKVANITRTNGVITEKTITATYNGTITKIFDGTIIAYIDQAKITFNGVESGDTVTVASATGTYDTPSVGSNKTVTIQVSLSGKDALNYICSNIITTGSITLLSKPVVWEDLTFIYDGTAKKPKAYYLDISNNKVYLTVTTTPTSAIYVGTYSASVSASHGDYGLTNTTITFTIEKRLVTISAGSTKPTKVYDGNTTVTTTLVQGTHFVVGNLVGSDVVNISYTTATYASANINNNILITVSGLSITGGANSSNYSLPTSFTIAGDITGILTLQANGGTISANSAWTGSGSSVTKGVVYNQQIGTLPTGSQITRTGYDFAGWKIGSTTITNTTVWTYSTNQTATAQWTEKVFTMTFDPNGGDTPNPTQKTFSYNEKTTNLATVTRTGYTFDGWWTTPATGGTKLTDTTVYSELFGANNSTVYARWIVNKYTLTLDANGGILASGTQSSYTVDYSTLVPINNPTKTGYTFAGWKSSNNLGHWVYNVNDPLTNQPFKDSSGKTIDGIGGLLNNSDPNYSTSLPSQYTPSGYASGTISVVSEQNPITGENRIIRLTRTSYTDASYSPGLFYLTQATANRVYYLVIVARISVGWTIEVTGNSVTSAEGFKFLTSKQGTGTWATYIVEAKSSNEGIFMNFGHTYIRNTNSSTNTTHPTFDLAGYYSYTASIQENDISSYYVGGTETLVAQWTSIEHNVTIDTNSTNGSYTVAINNLFDSNLSTVTRGAKIATRSVSWSGASQTVADATRFVSAWIPVVTGATYKITGASTGGMIEWKSVGGIDYYDQSSTSQATTYTNNATITIPTTYINYSTGQPANVVYTYMRFDGLISDLSTIKLEMLPTTFTGDKVIKVISNVNVTVVATPNSGYSATVSKGSGSGSFSNGTLSGIFGASTIIVNFNPNSYTLTFDANGGTTPNPTSKLYAYNAYTTGLATTTRQGFVFQGWYTAKEGGTKLTDTTVYGNLFGAQNATAYARWTPAELDLPQDGTLADAIYKTPYTSSQIAQPTTGTGSYTYTIVSGAPDGISFNSTTRKFEGTPTSNVGTYQITLLVKDTISNAEKTAKFTLKVVPKAMSYTVTPYSGVYDGFAHYATIKMTEPTSASVGYSGTSGNYTTYTLTATTSTSNFSQMGRTTAGTTTIYYQITAPNYVTVTASTYVTISKRTLETPTGLSWDTSIQGSAIAKWNAVSNATSYTVILYNSLNAQVASATPTTNSYDFKNVFTSSACSKYYFKVQAIQSDQNNYSNSSQSEKSPELSSYSVTFNMNGGGSPVPATQYVIHGQKASQPTDPERQGFSFNGWYKEPALTNLFNFTTETITSSITLYANWEANELKFNGSILSPKAIYNTYYTSNPFGSASGGTGSYSYRIVSGAPLGIYLNSDTRVFYGTPTGNVGNYNIVVEAKDNISLKTKNATFQLTVDLKQMSYTVTPYSGVYDGNVHYATIKMIEPSSASVGYSSTSGNYTTYTMTADTTTKNFTSLGRTQVGTTTIYFQIRATNYGSVQGSTTVTITKRKLATPTNLSWDTSTQGSAIAKWSAVSYATSYKVVLYNSSGAIVSTQTTTSTQYDFGSVFRSGAKSQHYFKVQAMHSDTTNNDDSDFSDESPRLSSYTVSFNTHGGSSVSSQYVIHGQKATQPSTPTRAGFVFDGWYTTDTYSTVFNFTAISINSATTIHAKWKANQIQFEDGEITPNAVYKTSYTSDPFPAAKNGSGSYTYSIEGWIPAGISLNSSTRTLSGTPTSDVGIYSIVIKATDNVSGSTATATFQFTITPFDLVIYGNTEKPTKVYDGNSNATVTSSHYVINGIQHGDTVTISFTSALYDSKDAGTNKIITVSGVKITGGTNSGNYTVPSSFTIYGDITKRTVTISSGPTKPSKVYDATKTVPSLVKGTHYIIENVVSGDTVNISYTAEYDTPNVGNNKTIYLKNITISGGTNSSNYVLISNNATISGAITALQVTISAGSTKPTKVYDGNTTVTTTLVKGTHYVINGVLSGDVVNISYTSATYSDANTGTDKTITVSGVTISGGTNHTNYSVASSFTIKGDITKANNVLEVNPTSVTIVGGNTQQITITTNKSGGTISYSSQNTNVATVSSSGLITAALVSSNSSTTITVTSAETTNYKSASVTVSVSVTVAYVKNDTTNKYYDSLQAAANASESGSYIILRNTYLTSPITFNKTLHLYANSNVGIYANKNNLTLFTPSSSGILILGKDGASGKLTLSGQNYSDTRLLISTHTGSSSNEFRKNIIVRDFDSDDGIIYGVKSLQINGGEYLSNTGILVWVNAGGYSVDVGYGVFKDNEETIFYLNGSNTSIVRIQDGVFENNYAAIAFIEKGKVEIKDGDFYNNGGSDWYSPFELHGSTTSTSAYLYINGGNFACNNGSVGRLIYAHSGFVEINGGDFDFAEGYSGDVDSGFFISSYYATIDIYGGYFHDHGTSTDPRHSSLFYNAGSLNISGGTFQYNYSWLGSVIINEAYLLIDGGWFDNNGDITSDYAGGVIYNISPDRVHILGGEFTNNKAYYGGVVYNHASTELTFCPYYVVENSAYYGGVIYNLGTLYLGGDYSYFDSNTSTYGGIVYNTNNGFVTVVGGDYVLNYAYYGGVFYTVGSNNILVIENGNFDANSANTGGVLRLGSGTASIENGTFKNSSASTGTTIAVASGSSLHIYGGTYTSSSTTNEIYTLSDINIYGSPKFSRYSKVYLAGSYLVRVPVYVDYSNNDQIIIDLASYTIGKNVVYFGSTVTPTKFVLANSSYNLVQNGQYLQVQQAVARRFSGTDSIYYNSIADAVTAASNSEYIYLLRNYQVPSTITISKTLYFYATANITLTAPSSASMFNFTSGSTYLLNSTSYTLTITGGSGYSVFNVNGASVYLKNVIITDNYVGDNDGIVDVVSGTFRMNSGSKIDYNSGSAIRQTGGTTSIGYDQDQGVSISSNTASIGPAILQTGGTSYIYYSTTISHNTAYAGGNYQNGGAIHRTGGNMYIYNGEFSSNYGANGGVIYNNASSSSLSISGGQFKNNNATSNGGVIYHYAGSLTISGGTFTSNTANTYGGVVYTNTSISISGGVFDSNKGKSTAGVIYLNSGTLTISGGIFENNSTDTSSTCYGGVICSVTGTTINISGSPSFTGNYAYYGGVIYNRSTLTINGTPSFTSNTAYYAGVIHNIIGTLTVNGGTFANNSATYTGGIRVWTGTATINGGIFQNNTAPNQGGSIEVDATTYIFGGTFVDNQARQAVYVNSSYELHLRSSPSFSQNSRIYLQSSTNYVRVDATMTNANPIYIELNGYTANRVVIQYASGYSPSASKFALANSSYGLTVNGQNLVVVGLITVYLNFNGGSRSSDQGWSYTSSYYYKSFVPGVGTLGTLPTPTRTNYTFKGWFTSTSGGTQIYASTAVPSSSKTYYAQWNPGAGTITISLHLADYTSYSNASGWSIDGTYATKLFAPSTGTIGAMPDLAKRVLENGNIWVTYLFLGYYTSQEGGTQITESTAVPARSTTYWARFSKFGMPEYAPPPRNGSEDIGGINDILDNVNEQENVVQNPVQIPNQNIVQIIEQPVVEQATQLAGAIQAISQITTQTLQIEHVKHNESTTLASIIKPVVLNVDENVLYAVELKDGSIFDNKKQKKFGKENEHYQATYSIK